MQYKTISMRTESLFKDRGSKFIGYVSPVRDEEEIKHFLSEIKENHPKARHVCYAYRLGAKGKDYRINDDGEPSGSAGLPIYNQLLSAELTYVIAAVVRYFGGTKLGIPGLINAYKEATVDALQENKIITKSLRVTYGITTEYQFHPFLMQAITKFGATAINEEYGEKVKLVIEFEQVNEHETLSKILAWTLQIPVTQLVQMKDSQQIQHDLIEREV